MQLLESSGNLCAIKGMIENPPVLYLTISYNHNAKFQKLAIFQLTPCLLDPAVTSWLSPESQDLWQQKVVATWQGGDCTPGTWRTKENDNEEQVDTNGNTALNDDAEW